MKKLNLFLLIFATLALCTGAWAQNAVAILYETDQVLTDACGGGNPIPDGTTVLIYWDNDSNGPDDDDPLAPLCNNPPQCPDGDAGEWNIDRFNFNGEATGFGAGLFYMEQGFTSVGLVPIPPRYYLRICVGSINWVSNVVTLVAGPGNDTEMGPWTCNAVPCAGCPLPPNPASLFASDIVCDSVEITWTYPAGDTLTNFFRVKRGADAIAIVNRVGGQSDYRYGDHGTLPGITFGYQIEAVNVCSPGDTAIGLSVQESGGRPLLPPTPTLVRADSACNGDVVVTWNFTPAFNGRFDILRNGVVVGTREATGSPPGNLTLTLTGQVGRANYCVMSVGFPSFCTSPAVCDSGGLNGAPPQVLNVNATDALCDTVRITWTDVAGETGYRILREGVIIQSVGVGVTTYNDLSGPCSTTQSYTVRAFNACAEGTNGDPNGGFKNCRPTTVTNVSATDGLYCDSTVVTWNDVADETGYNIYRDFVAPMDTLLASVAANVISYRDLTGTPGVIYQYAVRSSNGCGVQAAVPTPNAGNRRAAPAQVTGVSATDNNCGAVTITWTNLAGEDSFLVRRNGVQIGNTILDVTSFLDTTATFGTWFTYTVAAKNACGVGAVSAPPDSGRRILGLPAPATLTASNNLCDHVFISWGNIAGEDSFQVRRDGIRIGRTPIDSLSFIDTGPVPGTTYSYTVVGYNSCGAGSPSTPANGTRLPFPGAVTNLAATAGCDTIQFTWTAATNAVTYTLAQDGIDVTALIPGTSVNYVPGDDNVHVYGVRAINTCGAGLVDTQAVAGLGTPAAPSGLSATDDGCASIFLSWTNPGGESKVRIYRNGALVDSVNSPANTYSDTSATSGVAHLYAVRAVNACGNSVESNNDNGFRIAGPSIPTGLVATQNFCGAVRVDWNASSGVVDSYTIRRDGDSVGTAPAADTTFLDTGLDVAEYSYTVEAINNLCGGTGQTAPVIGISLLNPTLPTALAATTTRCDSVVLTWTASLGNVNGYHIFRDGTFIDQISGVDNTRYADAPLDNNTHRYTILAASNQCAYSDTVGASGALALPPTAAVFPAISNDRCDGILVEWAPASGSVDGYIILRGGIEVDTTAAGAVEFLDTEAPLGTHSYTIVTYSITCADGGPTSPISGERLENPPQVQNVAATDSSCENVTVTWDAAAGNFDNYRIDRNGGFLAYVEQLTTQYVDTTALENVTYEYMVCANDVVCGLGPLSVPDNGTRLSGATVPTDLAATDDDCADITVTWTASTGAFDSYNLYIDSDPPLVLPNTQTEYTHSTDAGVEHTYFVTAISVACGETDSSNVDAGLRLPVLGQVLNVNASDDNCDGIAVTWDNILGATTYYIYRDGVLTLYDSTATNSYLDEGVGVSECHDYAVSASNICGPGAPSENVNGCRATVPETPTGFQSTDDGCFQVGFSWTAANGAAGYIVHWGSEVDSVGAGIVSLEVPGIYPGPVMAWVVAYNACGNSGESNQDTSFAWLEPAPPTNFAATGNDCNTITLTWTDAPLFATQYVIVRDGSTLDNSIGQGIQTYVDNTAEVGPHLYQINAGNICTLSQPDTTSGERLGPPSVPTGLTVSVDSCDGIHVRWDDVATEDFYVVLRDGEPQDTLVSNNTEFDDLTVVAGVDYNYCVYGFNECGDGQDVCAHGERAATPPQVTGLTASVDSCLGIFLTWLDFSGELNYNIFRDGLGPVHTNAANDTDYVDTDALPGSSHNYSVSASNVCGEGEQSASVGGTRNQTPPAPASCSADSSCNGIIFTWSDVTGETSYTILRNGVAIDSVTANVTSYLDATPPPGTNGYCVVACNLCGCSDECCDTASPIVRPTIPQDIAASDTGCTIVHITWTNTANNEGYRVYRDGSPLNPVVGQNITQFDDSPPAAGTYQYTVRALHSCGDSDPSAQDAGRRRGAPPVPTGLTASVNQCNFISLQWSPSADADSYSVVRDNVVIAHVIPNLYQDDAATPGTHQYQVKALNRCDSSIASTPPVSGIRLGTPPQIPVITATDNRCDVVRITWTLATGATSYIVRREGTIIATQPGDSSGYSDAAAVANTTYSYNVTANSTCGDAPVSPPDNGTRLLVPQIPTGVSATDDRCDSIVVTWTIPIPSGDVDSFRVFLADVYVGGRLGTATRFAYAPPAGTTGQFTVRSWSNDCLIESANSAANSGFRPAAPGQVQNVRTATPTCDFITVLWNALNPAPDRYIVWRDSVRIDSTTLNTYTDAAVDDARNHRYHVTARNACGESVISAGTNGNELPLFRITGNIPDTVRCSELTETAIQHCPNVTVDSIFFSLDGGPYLFLQTINGNQGNIQFTIPWLPQQYTDAVLRIVSYRVTRRDTLVTEPIVVECLGADDNVSLIPNEFYLDQNFPNPFNPSTTIRFGVPRTSDVTIEVFDLAGRLAATLVSGQIEAGVHAVNWDCTDCPTGMYLLRLSTPDQVMLRKMLLMK